MMGSRVVGFQAKEKVAPNGAPKAGVSRGAPVCFLLFWVASVELFLSRAFSATVGKFPAELGRGPVPIW